MRESWRNCPGRPGYKVSSLGRCRSVDRVLSDGRACGGRMLSPRRDRDGYILFKVCGRWVPAHVLVLEAFHGPRPEGMEGCHGPQGQDVNSSDVLRWDTHQENIRDKERNKKRQPERLDLIGTHHPCRVATSVTVGAAGG